MATKPTIIYFPIRGRGEPIKLALAAKGVDFDVAPVDYQEMKANIDLYPFAQCPRYEDEDGNLSQSNTILRHVGRKYDMVGGSLADAARIDMIVDGIEDIKRKYLTLIYSDQLAEEAKKIYWSTHLDPASASARNSGAHFAYISKLVARYGADGWAVGSALSIADILLFDCTDAHLRIYPEEFKAAYPDLVAHYERVAAVPGIKAYLESPLRLEKVNNNGLG